MTRLNQLIDALRCLPGVGPKSAQRMVYHLLNSQYRKQGLHLAHCLEAAMQAIIHCHRCNNYSETSLCTICQNHQRDAHLLCVVETPADVLAIEQSNVYFGYYFVLMGRISPLDGFGPEEINLPALYQRISTESVQEVILALSPSIEGQTTVHFISELLADLPVQISQPAKGIPSGGELEFLDGQTISHALINRAKMTSEIE